MPKTIYGNDKSEADRIRDRLRPSSGPTLMDWPSDSTTTTQPTRTVTSIYHSSTQQGARVSAQPRGSRARDVGVFEDDPDVFAQNYGLNKPKGLQLSAFLLKRR